MLARLFLLFFLLTGCGYIDVQIIDGTTYRVVDPQVEPFVQNFEIIWGNRIDFKVVIEDLGPFIMGRCQVWSNGLKKVSIDTEHFYHDSKDEVESTVFHELGHCALNRDHLNDYIYYGSDIIPESLMHEGGATNYYSRYKEYYQKELFGRL